MKKLLLCSVLAAFTCVSAVQAGDEKAPAQAKACCTEKAKATDCSACCSGKKAVTKKADSTAKGATQLIAKN